jgi:hypothetical protein
MNTGFGVAAMLLGMSLQGCSTVVRVAHPDGNAANRIHDEGVVYGTRYVEVRPDDAGEVQSPGIHEVTVKDNWFYDLLGVVTLGIYSPHDVSYRNVTPAADDGGVIRRRPSTRPAGGQ